MSQQVNRDEFRDESPATTDLPVAQVITPVQTILRPAVDPVLVAAPVAPATAVRTASSRHFAPDAVIAASVGVLLLVVGLIAITRGGFDGPMSEPVVQVLGFDHTTTLGIIEIVLGVALLASGAAASRAGARFFGGVLAIGGFVAAVQSDSFREPLAIESAFAWLLVLAGSLVVASSLLLPRYLTRSTTVANTRR